VRSIQPTTPLISSLVGRPGPGTRRSRTTHSARAG
jgi:hypothetical protein